MRTPIRQGRIGAHGRELYTAQPKPIYVIRPAKKSIDLFLEVLCSVGALLIEGPKMDSNERKVTRVPIRFARSGTLKYWDLTRTEQRFSTQHIRDL